MTGLTQAEASALRRRHRNLSKLLLTWVVVLTVANYWLPLPESEAWLVISASFVMLPPVVLLLALWRVQRRAFLAAGEGAEKWKVAAVGWFIPFSNGWQLERLLKMAVDRGRD